MTIITIDGALSRLVLSDVSDTRVDLRLTNPLLKISQTLLP